MDNIVNAAAGAQGPPVYVYTMKVTPGRVRGATSEFREGALTLTADQVAVTGKVVLPIWQQVLLLIFPGLCIGILIMAILLEYAIRIAKSLRIPWNLMEEIVLDSRKQRACLVFRNPENPQKTVSLAFRLDPNTFSHFVQVMQYFAPEKMREGKIGGTSALVVLLIILGALIAIPIIFYLATMAGR